MEDSKEDRSVREEHRGQEREEYSQVEDPESPWNRSKVLRSWFVSIFVAVDWLTDTNKQEEHDRYDDVEGIEILVEWEDPKIVKVPEKMKNDHEQDGESSEYVKFDESLGVSRFSVLLSFQIHFHSFSLSSL